MTGKIFDSHAHYDDRAFKNDRDAVLKRLFENGVSGIINCASDIKTSEFSLGLAEKYENIFAAVGVHPHEAERAGTFDEALLTRLLGYEKAVAVGEIGLDYHYNFSPKEKQLYWFEKQLELAVRLDIPVIVHDREAHGDTLRLLAKYRPKGVIHCFSGSVEMAAEVLKLGMYIGLGGAVTFKNAKTPAQVAKAVPLDRLLLETDAPYMTPVPYRGERCDSLHIKYTAEKIAGLRGIPVDTLLVAVEKNARKLFNI